MVNAARYRARSVRAGDASQEIANWFADPDRVAPLNLQPRQLELPDLRRFFSSFDNRSRFLLALIDTQSDRICGFVHAEILPLHRISRISFLNGPNDVAARRALISLTPVLLDLQFRRYGVEKVSAHVLAQNVPLCRYLDRLGFQREGYLRAQVRAAGGVRLDQVLFGLLPTDLKPRADDPVKTAG